VLTFSDKYLYTGVILASAVINGAPQALSVGGLDLPYRWVGGDVSSLVRDGIPRWDWDPVHEKWVENLDISRVAG